jgi:Zn-finger nucleic acid-binding protein
MRCPRCKRDVDLVHEVLLDEIEVDRCPLCDGLWLDPGEGERITRPNGLPDVIARRARPDTASLSNERNLSCPRCGQDMRPEKYSRSFVVIDRCGCGVWLDAGEAEKIQGYRAQRLEELRERYSGSDPESMEQLQARADFDLGRG